VAGAKRTRRKQTKKRDEIVTPGPNRGGYLGTDSRPIARNPRYGEASASPGMGISTGLSPCQLQHRPTPRPCCRRAPSSPPAAAAATPRVPPRRACRRRRVGHATPAAPAAAAAAAHQARPRRSSAAGVVRRLPSAVRREAPVGLREAQVGGGWHLTKRSTRHRSRPISRRVPAAWGEGQRSAPQAWTPSWRRSSPARCRSTWRTAP